MNSPCTTSPHTPSQQMESPPGPLRTKPDSAVPRAVRLLRLAAVFPIRLYQWFISPVLPPSCRFSPSCSAYAVEAVLTHGVLHGGWFALRRLLRCHPWSKGGFDPVPGREGKFFG